MSKNVTTELAKLRDARIEGLATQQALVAGVLTNRERLMPSMVSHLAQAEESADLWEKITTITTGGMPLVDAVRKMRTTVRGNLEAPGAEGRQGGMYDAMAAERREAQRRFLFDVNALLGSE